MTPPRHPSRVTFWPETPAEEAVAIDALARAGYRPDKRPSLTTYARAVAGRTLSPTPGRTGPRWEPGTERVNGHGPVLVWEEMAEGGSW